MSKLKADAHDDDDIAVFRTGTRSPARTTWVARCSP